jgi:hypothetical protein
MEHEAKLSAYYKGSTMLELAIWISEIAEQSDRNINLLTPDIKMGCCIDSLWMVDIIVPNVLSFLHDNAIKGDNQIRVAVSKGVSPVVLDPMLRVRQE